MVADVSPKRPSCALHALFAAGRFRLANRVGPSRGATGTDARLGSACNPARRTALTTLATGLAALTVSAQTQATPLAQPAPTAWPEVAAHLPKAVFCGSARLRFWGFAVYDAQLWVDPAFRANRLGAHPLALSLTYLRALRGRAIAERSITEMRRQGPLEDDQAAQWLAEMTRIFPDVAAGDRLTGLWQPGQGARFWFNAAARGAIADDVFASRFFGIWLSDATSEPDLRRALLANAPT